MGNLVEVARVGELEPGQSKFVEVRR